ncbi:hypothetical protein RHMOL_Rhmol06G0269200 [Rhododendron molle]|uniref:Uncharacterized protein n=1 Tax=Rhododendron molle TaxID=49168 RepID=A0ACC0NGU4_RHOML|nr:hypothetical protein RHMOL_Rhmol06G0269200 [Rhododendron molle]
MPNHKFLISWQLAYCHIVSLIKASDKVPYDSEVSGIQNVKLYTYRELSIATGGFSPANKVGEGGFGSVYKVTAYYMILVHDFTLHTHINSWLIDGYMVYDNGQGRLKDGTMVAIKVLSAESRQGRRILFYGYLENNSLAQTLLKGGGGSEIQFNWKTQSTICIGVARGLAFLHEELRPHIVHRDIKASNVLLDKDLTPKISDFGLAKLFPAHVTHISTRVAGTLGYLAPEYAIRGQLTRKADIYSFGVLLLEIVSGRCNNNTQLPVEEQYLLEWKRVLKRKWIDFARVFRGRRILQSKKNQGVWTTISDSTDKKALIILGNVGEVSKVSNLVWSN